MDQWTRIGDPKVDPHVHGHLYFDKEHSIEIGWSLTNGEGTTVYPYTK